MYWENLWSECPASSLVHSSNMRGVCTSHEIIGGDNVPWGCWLSRAIRSSTYLYLPSSTIPVVKVCSSETNNGERTNNLHTIEVERWSSPFFQATPHWSWVLSEGTCLEFIYNIGKTIGTIDQWGIALSQIILYILRCSYTAYNFI